MSGKRYTVRRAEIAPRLDADWDAPEWALAEIAEVDIFREESKSRHPVTRARLLYTNESIFGQFKVDDQYVRAVRTRFLDPVCRDSCVEFFVRPVANAGYLNFEFNCSGTLYASCVRDPVRTESGFRDFTRLTPEQGKMVKIHHTLPSRVEPELAGPVTWFLGFEIPLRLLEAYVGPLGDVAGQVWSANFYKCGDETSHPHWASWAPLKQTNFHLPECFGALIFES